MADPAVVLKNVWFSYSGEPALENVNLEVAAGDFVSIVGPNGGGKSTMLKLMLGLLRPDSGTVRVFGVRPRRALARVGYVPQNADMDPKFPVSVLDVVLTGRLGRSRAFGPYTAADKNAARGALEKIDLLDLAARPFSDLSGGQRRRALIARAIATEPSLLLLDEPTANLDTAVEEQLYNLLQTLNERMTIVLVSHDLLFVSRHVRSVVCVRREARMHPVGDATPEALGDLCGFNMRMVHHDRTCVEESQQ